MVRRGGRPATWAGALPAVPAVGRADARRRVPRTCRPGPAPAVLFDARVVHAAVVPALFAVLGDRARRLPKRLGRVLPDADAEGGEPSRRPASPEGRRAVRALRYSR
ncbi:hypothetical protein L1856_33980 [Streptomyces sp. Tue 6430]|nr:hypothetical protein [Streptomyces sp. Tue 6430]